MVTVSEFGYDYASRRAFTREYDFGNGGWANPQITRRVFDGMDVVQERNATNQVMAQLVRDGNIGGILSRTTNAGAAFYGYDGNGNVTLLTDASGTDVGHYRYDTFGNTLEAVGPRAGENPYRFSTKEWHAQSGLYNYREIWATILNSAHEFTSFVRRIAHFAGVLENVADDFCRVVGQVNQIYGKSGNTNLNRSSLTEPSIVFPNFLLVFLSR